jgi:hypothetical protein
VRRGRHRIFDLLAVALIVLAFSVARDDVRGLRAPYDGDHFRDLAQAQATRDGHPLSDPHYSGELIWYNPLVPWIVAGGSALTRTTPALFHVRGGPYLNLLAPIAFYVVGVALVGHGAAFAALVIFLFFNSRTDPALVSPTYSPWLFVATFAQGLFFAAVAVMTRVWQKPSDTGAAILGLLAGLAFLAHTGPALVLGFMALALLNWRVIAIAGVTAFAVASPFLYAIVWHYHLAVVNEMAMAWWRPLTLQGLPTTLRANGLTLVAAAAGLLIVPSKIARVWIAAAALLYAYALTRESWPTLPALVPGFHFWRYVFAAATLFAGATVWWICRRVPPPWDQALLVGVVAVALAWYFPQYKNRFDFVYGRAVALERRASQEEMTAFLHKATPPGAVILGTRGASLQIIGPAGRHVVAVNANWSNPYVENATRVRDRDAMLDAVKGGDLDRFNTLATRYGVTHVVGADPDECAKLAASGLHFLYAFGDRDVCLFDRP